MDISFRNLKELNFRHYFFLKSILFASLFSFLIIFSPLFFILFFFSIISISNSRFSFLYFIIISLLIFITLNLGKYVDGDLLSYLNLQKAFSKASLTDLLEKPQNFSYESGSYRTSEFIGYSVFWFIANYISSSAITFSVFSTLLIYLPCIFAYRALAKLFSYSRIQFIILILCLIFVGINFIQTTHIVRQYISASLFIFSISKYYNYKRISFLIFSLLALGFHNSIAVLYLLFFLIEKLDMLTIYLERKRLWFINFKFTILLLFTILIAGLIFFSYPIFLLSDNGNISKIALILDILLILFTLFLSKKIFKTKFDFSIYVLYSTIFLIILSFVYLEFLIPALRLYLFLEFLRPFIISNIFYRYFYLKKKKYLLLIFFVLVLFSFFSIRFISNPWIYFNKTGLNSFGISIFDVISSF